MTKHRPKLPSAFDNLPTIVDSFPVINSIARAFAFLSSCSFTVASLSRITFSSTFVVNYTEKHVEFASYKSSLAFVIEIFSSFENTLAEYI